MNKLSDELLKLAMRAGLCAEHTQQWNRDWSEEELLNYYKTNPNWCLERRFPSLDLMRKYFKTPLAKNKGVYIDDYVTMRADGLCYIFNNCTVGVITGGVSRFYFGLGSIGKIIVEDVADCVIDYYDDSQIEVELRGKARLTVYRYGDKDISIIGGTNYKVRDKRKREH